MAHKRGLFVAFGLGVLVAGPALAATPGDLNSATSQIAAGSAQTPPLVNAAPTSPLTASVPTTIQLAQAPPPPPPEPGQSTTPATPQAPLSVPGGSPPPPPPEPGAPSTSSPGGAPPPPAPEPDQPSASPGGAPPPPAPEPDQPSASPGGAPPPPAPEPDQPSSTPGGTAPPPPPEPGQSTSTGGGSTWNSIAAALYRVKGKVHVAIGYSGTQPSEQEAIDAAVQACKDAGGGSSCKSKGAWNSGCVYITTGSAVNRAGWASGETANSAVERCKGDGFTCKKPIGGCVD